MILEEFGVQPGILVLGRESFKPGKGGPQGWRPYECLVKLINIYCVQLHVVHVL